MENAHLENSRWVTGCANDFRFGKSEMVSQADITKYVATFFRAPYSKAVDAQGEGGAGYEGEAGGDEDDEGSPGDDEEKRTIVLVGHGFDNEIRYLHGTFPHFPLSSPFLFPFSPFHLPPFTLQPSTPIYPLTHTPQDSATTPSTSAPSTPQRPSSIRSISTAP